LIILILIDSQQKLDQLINISKDVIKTNNGNFSDSVINENLRKLLIAESAVDDATVKALPTVESINERIPAVFDGNFFVDIPRRPDQLIFNSTKGEYQNTVDYYSTIRTIFLTLRENVVDKYSFLMKTGLFLKR
jgi:hypothetical protein